MFFKINPDVSLVSIYVCGNVAQSDEQSYEHKQDTLNYLDVTYFKTSLVILIDQKSFLPDLLYTLSQKRISCCNNSKQEVITR